YGDNATSFLPESLGNYSLQTNTQLFEGLHMFADISGNVTRLAPPTGAAGIALGPVNQSIFGAGVTMFNDKPTYNVSAQIPLGNAISQYLFSEDRAFFHFQLNYQPDALMRKDKVQGWLFIDVNADTYRSILKRRTRP